MKHIVRTSARSRFKPTDNLRAAASALMGWQIWLMGNHQVVLVVFIISFY